MPLFPSIWRTRFYSASSIMPLNLLLFYFEEFPLNSKIKRKIELVKINYHDFIYSIFVSVDAICKTFYSTVLHIYFSAACIEVKMR